MLWQIRPLIQEDGDTHTPKKKGVYSKINCVRVVQSLNRLYSGHVFFFNWNASVLV